MLHAPAQVRVNQMDSFYKPEVDRTNRIGVGMTGVHEFAWKFFKLDFRSVINPDFHGFEAHRGHMVGSDQEFPCQHDEDPRIRAASFWMFLSRLSNAVVEEGKNYAAVLGMSVPHTMLTIKPAGTTSKLFGLTEGWHLPSMRRYLRWVQFRNDDPLVAEYQMRGYPIQKLKTYEGTTIVGFPTEPTICSIGMPDELIVTAGEATPEEQYEWLRLGERFWIDGWKDPFDPNSGHGFGNQISYTLKYVPTQVSYEEFEHMLRTKQPTVRCCSVMPQNDSTAYEYSPRRTFLWHCATSA